MNQQNRIYKPEYATELISIAEGDLETANALAAQKVGRVENIIYHCEQAIEKCLKAVLCFRGKPILHTHNLGMLVMALGDAENIPHGENLDSLSEFATIRRSVETGDIIEDEDVQTAIEVAGDVLGWAHKIIRS